MWHYLIAFSANTSNDFTSKPDQHAISEWSFVIFCNLNGASPEFIFGRLWKAIGFLHNKFPEMQISPVDLFPILNYWMGLSYTMSVYIYT